MFDVCQHCRGQCCDRFAVFTNNLKNSNFGNSPNVSVLVNTYRINGEVIPLIPHKPLEDGKGWIMSCQNHENETGKCKIYSERPEFCRQYICRWAIETLDLVSEF